MPNGSGFEWAECSLTIRTGCRVQVFSLIRDIPVDLSAGIQSAGDSVCMRACVRTYVRMYMCIIQNFASSMPQETDNKESIETKQFSKLHLRLSYVILLNCPGK